LKNKEVRLKTRTVKNLFRGLLCGVPRKKHEKPRDRVKRPLFQEVLQHLTGQDKWPRIIEQRGFSEKAASCPCKTCKMPLVCISEDFGTY
jgi:hypothetical protein